MQPPTLPPIPYQVPGAPYPPAPGRTALGLGIAGLVVGLAAATFIWVPFCGMAAYPVAGVGLLLAVAGVVVSLATRRRQPLLLPLIGTFVCAAAIVTGVVAQQMYRDRVERDLAQAQRNQAALDAAEARQRQKAAADRAAYQAAHPNWKAEEMLAEAAAERAARPKDLPPYEITSNYDIERGLFKSTRTVTIVASGDLTEAGVGRILDYVSGQYPRSSNSISVSAGGYEVGSRAGDGKNVIDPEKVKAYRRDAGLEK